MKILNKSAAEAFSDLKLGSILNPAITKGPKDVRVFTAATLLLKDSSVHSRSKQRTDLRVLELTLKFLALKKTSFSPVKNTSQICFDFCLPLFYAT